MTFQYAIVVLGFAAHLLFGQALVSSRAMAGLIILPSRDVNPANVRQIFTSADAPDSDGVKPVGAGFQGKFFGQSVAQIFAAENGNLSFRYASAPGAGSFQGAGEPAPPPTSTGNYPTSDATRPQRIMAFWDDYFFNPSATGVNANQIVEAYVPGKYLSVSWLNINAFFDATAGGEFIPTSRSAQVLWFEGDTPWRGFQFQAGDIAIGQVGHVAGTSNFGDFVYAYMGLDSGTSAIVTTPDNPSGYFNQNNTGLLAWETENSAAGMDKFFLFRPTETGGVPTYTVSKQSLSAVPEPTSILLCLVGGAGLCARTMAKWLRKFRSIAVSEKSSKSHVPEADVLSSLNHLDHI